MKRPRKQRDPNNGVVDPGKRHIKLLIALESYGISDTKHLAALSGTSVDNIEMPLRQLYDADLIDKLPNNLYNRDEHTAPQVYKSTQKGFELLERRGLVPFRAMWKAQGGNAGHNLKVCLALQSFEVAACNAGLRFIPWEEILLEAPEKTKKLSAPYRFELDDKHHLAPDAMFCLANTEDYRLFIPFELDISDHGKQDYQYKASQYHDLVFSSIYKRQLGLDATRAAIATITTNKSRRDTMASFTHKQDPSYFKVMSQYADFEKTPVPALDILDGWFLPGKPAHLFNLKDAI